MNLPNQTTGNCAWANSEAALYPFFILQTLYHYVKFGVTLDEIIAKPQALFDEFRDFVIRYDADKYQTRHLGKLPKNTPYYASEPHFLQLIKPTLPQDLARKVDTLLNKQSLR